MVGNLVPADSEYGMFTDTLSYLSMNDSTGPLTIGLWWHSEKHPGPMDPCSVSGKWVQDNQDDLFCEACLNLGHQHCVKMSKNKYYHWASIDDSWICPKCERESSTLSADACVQSSGVGSSGSQCSFSHCNTPSSVLYLPPSPSNSFNFHTVTLNF